MNTKNICLISRSIYPHPISRHSQNMQTFDGWARYFDNIVLVSQNNSKVKKQSSHMKVEGILLPLNSNKYLNIALFTILGIFEINKLFKKYSFDIFQASDAGGAFLAYLASRIYKKKFIFEIQGDIFDYPSQNRRRIHSLLVKFFSKFLAKRSDYIRIVSPFLYKPLDKLHINRNKIFLVPPRCDATLFNYHNIKSEKPKELTKSKFNILFIGNLIYAKGVDILLEAFALIENKYANISLSYVGEGEEKQKLYNRAKELGIEKKVIFFGKLKYQDIPILMSYSDILVLPSREEGVGRVILEAMSMKLPVVASKVGGIPLVIDDLKDGLLFNSEDVIGLKRQILSLIENKELSLNLANAAHQKFINNYEYEVSINKFLKMYKSIL